MSFKAELITVALVIALGACTIAIPSIICKDRRHKLTFERMYIGQRVNADDYEGVVVGLHNGIARVRIRASGSDWPAFYEADFIPSELTVE